VASRELEPDYPISLSSPSIFGPLGLPLRLPLLGNIRKIKLHLEMDYRNPYWSMKRHCARLQQFVKVIKEHADAEAKASLLTDLSVTMGLVGAIRYQQDMDARNIFALEELAPLRGIENVEIGGEN
jgi:hypothetical protein